jgi:hypothetical protein
MTISKRRAYTATGKYLQSAIEVHAAKPDHFANILGALADFVIWLNRA